MEMKKYKLGVSCLAAGRAFARNACISRDEFALQTRGFRYRSIATQRLRRPYNP